MAQSKDSGFTRRGFLAAGAAAAGMAAATQMNVFAEAPASAPATQKATSASMPSDKTRGQILDTAEGRIREHRMGEARLQFVDGDGKPAKGFRGRIRLARHEFKVGCTAYGMYRIDDAALQRDYAERFAALMNYATLPFYWGAYEPRLGRRDERSLERVADWCKQHRIVAKGHTLVWHEVLPRWTKEMPDEEVLAHLQDRVKQIVSHYAGRIDIWDVVNEATTSHNHDNAIGRWIKEKGAGACVEESLRWAHQANPDAKLLYNDFDIWGKQFAPGRAYPALVEYLLRHEAPLAALGIQSHMHKEIWPIEKTWEGCETYARFGSPLHWTEMTVLSGRPKAADDHDWFKERTDWPTTAAGEKSQLEHGREFYTLLFSHPAVEAITWWDFSDLQAWQGAPAGLIRRDMSPKPLYDWLMEAFHRQWTTEAAVQADAAGEAAVRCFYGEYEVEGKTESGAMVKGRFRFGKRGGREVSVRVG